eukprot:CAMPEP_0178954944 /NCGR_PEP_ID=MMETSP0789-20121207/9304_1 /TAXON_ID=3005 /ORGANISM="Rhizosolenia setigera, Strain CCMP 1694" /LENGTH=174 /DNA_ID=CAMNT_0020636467 /DNA_START=45 /DNA_END=569 /DNA_ORIENTATION=-
MKSVFSLAVVALLSISNVSAFSQPKGPVTKNGPKLDLKEAAMTTFAALTIASNVVAAPLIADAYDTPSYLSSPISSSTLTVSEKVTRQGLYQDYEVDIEQQVDDARSTFKPAAETKKKKGKYTALLAVLVVGSFVIPMAQYFWYVRDDSSSDEFFATQQAPPEPEKPKKKGWFN